MAIVVCRRHYKYKGMAKILNCRTCAKQISSGDLVPIFEEIENKIIPIDSIKDFHNFNFKILQNDGLSQFICYNCLQCFVRFVEFLKQCEKSQFILQKQLIDKCNFNFNDLEETVNITKFLDYQNPNEGLDFLENPLEEYLEFENNDGDNNSLSESSYSHNNIIIDEDFIDKEFQIREFLEFHNTEILCEFCGIEFHIKNLEEHQKSAEHLGIKVYSCEFCDKSYKTYEVLRQHKYKKHKNEKLTKKKYICGKCNKIFYDENRLNLHIQNFHKNYLTNLPQRKHICTECGRSFTYLGVLERHIVKFHKNSKKSQRKYNCTECERSYTRSDHLQLHMRREHLNEKPFQCANCGKKYAAGYQLTYHMKSTHTVKIEQDYECDICHKIFTKKYAMNRHKKKYHSQKQCICTICNKTFNNYGKLDRHYTNVHNNELGNGNLLKTNEENNLNLNVPNDKKRLNINCNDNNYSNRDINLDIEIFETENDIAEIDSGFLDLIDGVTRKTNAVELLLKDF